MPELSDNQLASFRPVTRREHARLKKGVRHVGRPPKPNDEKTVPISMRVTRDMIDELKRAARDKGVRGWQTYAKKLIEDGLRRG